jgi:hypothetical protein
MRGTNHDARRLPPVARLARSTLVLATLVLATLALTVLAAGGCGGGEGTTAPDGPDGLRLWIDDGPDKPRTTIQIELETAGWLTLTVRDTEGGLVRLLVDQQLPAGRHQVAWSGDDDAGDRVASGPYWAVAATADGREAIAMMLIK